jgi:hypothetical protein
VFSPGDWLVSCIWFFLSTGQVATGAEVTHCQFVQGGQICCFSQVTAVLPYHCNSVWSGPPPVRWCNLVLNTALSLLRLAQGFIMALLCDAGLLLQPHSQPLLLVLFLFTESLASCPTPVLWGRCSISPNTCC